MPANRVTSKSPWHIILVLDDSGSMSGEPSKNVNNAILELFDVLVTTSMGMKPYFKVSVISFGSSFSTLAEAVTDTDIDDKAIAVFNGGSGSTNAAAALEEARRILTSNPGAPADFEPFVFFMSDGFPDNSQAALEEADRIKGLELESGRPRIVTLGFGEADDNFMQSVATNPELYKKMVDSKDIVKLLPAIGSVGTDGQGGAAQAEKDIAQL